MRIDELAVGDPVEFSLACVEHHLPDMLRHCGVGDLADEVAGQPERVGAAVAEVRALMVKARQPVGLIALSGTRGRSPRPPTAGCSRYSVNERVGGGGTEVHVTPMSWSCTDRVDRRLLPLQHRCPPQVVVERAVILGHRERRQRQRHVERTGAGLELGQRADEGQALGQLRRR